MSAVGASLASAPEWPCLSRCQEKLAPKSRGPSKERPSRIHFRGASSSLECRRCTWPATSARQVACRERSRMEIHRRGFSVSNRMMAVVAG